MRVLISAGWLGGAGGAERAMHSVLRALEGHDIDVVVRRRLGGPLAETGPLVRVFPWSDVRWKAAAIDRGAKGLLMRRLVNPVRRRILPRYDVYLQFFDGPTLGATVRATVRLLIPSGNPITKARACGFDYVALQAPDNARSVAEGVPTVLLPPPLYDVSAHSERPQEAIPEKYYLTVFNPYGTVKGTDDLRAAVAAAPHPIVWCHSQKTTAFEIAEDLRMHPRILHVNDPSLGQLRHLYENCLAYLSFSQREGFGWSIADALRYSSAVVSREVGILSYAESRQPGTVRLGEKWTVDWSVLPDHVQRVDRDLEWVSPARFRDRLRSLARMKSVSDPVL